MCLVSTFCFPISVHVVFTLLRMAGGILLSCLPDVLWSQLRVLISLITTCRSCEVVFTYSTLTICFRLFIIILAHISVFLSSNFSGYSSKINGTTTWRCFLHASSLMTLDWLVSIINSISSIMSYGLFVFLLLSFLLSLLVIWKLY